MKGFAPLLHRKTLFPELIPLVDDPALHLFPKLEGSGARRERVHHLGAVDVLPEVGMPVQHEHVFDAGAGFAFNFHLEQCSNLIFGVQRGASGPP